jgi:DEAD/DEAH box helicase domain-containing protein
MRRSLGIVWDSHQQDFRTYFEQDVEALIAHLQRAGLVVGFNIIGFDYSVLRGYTRFNFQQLNILDMLREIYARLRCRVSLDALGRATLAMAKSADRLQALEWFKIGRMDLVEAYYKKDVERTRDLFQYGLDNGHLLFEHSGQGRMRIPLDWQLPTLVQRGKDKQRLAEHLRPIWPILQAAPPQRKRFLHEGTKAGAVSHSRWSVRSRKSSTRP